MERTTIAAIFADREALSGQTVTVCGWARTIRDMKTFGFIELNDGSCFKNLQVVMDANVLNNYKEIAGQNVGAAINGVAPWLDKATWTVLFITVMGLVGAVSPLGKVAGSAEVSNLLLYSVIALLASRASLLELADAPAWILTGFIILAVHGVLMVIICKLLKLDLFTGAVASLANIGGTASAPVLAGSYSGSLVPVGILMALMGYVIGTPGGILTARLMSMLA